MLLATGIVALVGMLGGKLVNAARLPAVTGYIIIGILLGPSCFGILNSEALGFLGPVQTMGFSLIAIAVGGELSLVTLRRLGKPVVIISIAEVIGAFVITYLFVRLLGAPVRLALMLGTLATATAPAATLAVCHECKADGDLTRTLLATVALDDAWAVISFAVAISVVNSLNQGDAVTWTMLLNPMREIGISVALGSIIGLFGMLVSKLFKSHADTLVISLAMLFLNAGLASHFGVSIILTGIVAGALMTNLGGERRRLFTILEEIETPVYILFFALAGAHLQLASITHVGFLGAAYVIGRVFGKVAGAWSGASLVKSPPVVRKYLGLTLVPQAGVAVGLAAVAAQKVPAYSDTVMTIILASVVIYELTGPVLTRFALHRAGEVNQDERKLAMANPSHSTHHVAVEN